jgi:nucleotide-binding universal stress UspA family protein
MKTLVIVVGYERSELAQQALAHALAVSHGAAQAKIVVAEIVSIPMPDRGGPMAPSNAQAVLDLHKSRLATDMKAFTVPEHVSLELVVRFGEPAPELCNAALEADADFIIVGTHGRKGLEHFFLGSVAERVVQKAPCTVIVVRPKLGDLTPKVEPPCEHCTSAKKAAGDPNVWCQAHTHHASRPMHLYYRYPEHFARGSMTLRIDE